MYHAANGQPSRRSYDIAFIIYQELVVSEQNSIVCNHDAWTERHARNTETFPSRALINSGVAANLATILYIIQRLHLFLVETSVTHLFYNVYYYYFESCYDYLVRNHTYIFNYAENYITVWKRKKRWNITENF